ncbi:hypothetical protein SmJEL517_g03484 [Synchytrium microbalum]|uniref:GST C-terminal domain-containing protein n=1 Tax=Synchytrium microbalum TaxID=1806994 RepID=A0A507C3T7_9FUNG|nr:uncharacterized protein SmJEL517_g03484 [Synchytrium microbalum]TPX33739.1 hypothetical protein SmJEL517_g03484 [Synchytrium microbalum]
MYSRRDRESPSFIDSVSFQLRSSFHDLPILDHHHFSTHHKFKTSLEEAYPIMELYCFPADKEFHVPTRDPFSLVVQAYLSMTGAQYTLVETTDTNISKTGELPMLKDGADSICGAANIISYTTLVEEILYDAWLYTRWVESAKAENERTDESLLYRTLPVKPVVSYFTHYDPAGVKARLSQYRNSDEVYKAVNEAYESISAKLDSKDYFFGKLATSLDAHLYGHLTFHAIRTLPAPHLFAALDFSHPSLLAYTARVKLIASKPPTHIAPKKTTLETIQTYITSLPDRIRNNIQRRWVSSSGKLDSEEVKKQMGNVAAVVGAVGAVLVFNWYYGIIEVSFGGKDEEEEEETSPRHMYVEEEEEGVEYEHEADGDDDEDQYNGVHE